MRKLIYISLILLTLPVLWIAGGYLLVFMKEREVDKKWAATLYPVQTLPARYPSADANVSALQLEALSAEFGVDLATKTYTNRRHPTEQKRKAVEAIKDQLKAYVYDQLKKDNSSIETAPKDVQAFYESEAPAIQKVVDFLITSETPRWESHIERYVLAPIPNLLGQLETQWVLMLDILEKKKSNRESEAVRTLEASWKLNQSLSGRGQLLCELIAVSVARSQSAVMRKMDGLDAGWESRLQIQNYLPGILDSEEVEAWSFVEFTRNDGELRPGEKLVGKLTPLMKPYLLMMQLDYSDKLCEAVKELKEQNICFTQPKASGAVKFSEWNIMWKKLWPEPYKPWKRVAKLNLDNELTYRILHIRRTAREDGRWPKEMKDLSQSMCPLGEWIYHADTKGATIHFNKEWKDDPENPLILPLSFQIEP